MPKAPPKTDGRNGRSLRRALRQALLLLPRLIGGQARSTSGVKKKRDGKNRALPHPAPTIELVDVHRIGSLTPNRDATVAVVMPCIDVKLALETARLLANRAGMHCRIIVVDDRPRQGFVRTFNDTAARITARYIVYLAQDAYPGRNWLREAHEALEKSGKGLLGFNDGTYRGRIATFGLVRMDWARTLYGGPIFHPGYNCHGADNELTVIARALGSYMYEPNCTLVEYDPHKEEKPGHKNDAKLFRQRFVAGFDGLVPLESLRQLALDYKVDPALLSDNRLCGSQEACNHEVAPTKPEDAL